MQVCWICRATKGSHDLSMCYTNTSDDAAWLNTIYLDEPWEVKPTLSFLPGFDIKMLGLDILHIFHLGVCRDLIGSALRVLCRGNLFNGRNIEQKLGFATLSLKRYAKRNKLTLVLHKLTKQNLTFKSREYPEIRCKGYDSYVTSRWLVKDILPNNVGSIDDTLATALWSADSVLSLLMGGERFLDSEEISHKQTVGKVFIRSYMHLATTALSEQKRLFRVRPKFHLFHHLIMDGRSLNPHYASTWLDEDAIKRWMGIKKKVHKRRATESSIKRWILGLKLKLLVAHEEKHCVSASVSPSKHERFLSSKKTWWANLTDPGIMI